MQSYPKAIGPYSAFKKAGDLLFVSGQIPLDPATNELISGDIKAQTRRVCENIAAILAENGLNFGAVVKTAVFLADISDFAAVNEIYGEFFTPPYPARSCVAVKSLPKGARVEIEVIAFLAK